MVRLIVALLLLSACRKQQAFTEPEPGLERMLEQPRVDPFAPSTFYADGRAMRVPPAGAIPMESLDAPPAVLVGRTETGYVTKIPLRIDRAGIEHGRERFEVVCATCHGIAGDGQSVVAANMQREKPASMTEPHVLEQPVGELYRTMSEGFGLMPGYAAMLSVEERWQIVAYVRALQRSRHVPAAQLDPKQRAALEEQSQ